MSRNLEASPMLMKQFSRPSGFPADPRSWSWSQSRSLMSREAPGCQQKQIRRKHEAKNRPRLGSEVQDFLAKREIFANPPKQQLLPFNFFGKAWKKPFSSFSSQRSSFSRRGLEMNWMTFAFPRRRRRRKKTSSVRVGRRRRRRESRRCRRWNRVSSRLHFQNANRWVLTVRKWVSVSERE